MSQTTGFEMYHPKFSRLETDLKRFRKGTIGYVESSARIPFPFAVKYHISYKHTLGWRDNGTSMFYVDLRAAVGQKRMQ